MTQKEPKDKRMDEIIRVAVEEFLERGYEGTSMEAIASRAGISKGGLYHHFKNKDEILLQANRVISEPIFDMMCKAAEKPTASEGLAWYIRNYLEYWPSHRKELVFFFLSMTKLLDSPVFWEMYEKYTEGYIAFLKDLYERGIASGEFIPHQTYENAVILMAAIDGIPGYLLMDKKLNLENIINIYQERFIHAFRVKNDNRRNREGS